MTKNKTIIMQTQLHLKSTFFLFIFSFLSQISYGQIGTENPSLIIEKTADKVEVSVGQVISYTITVENNGNVDLTNVVMTDVFAGGATYSSGDDGDNILETNETWTYTADYVVTLDDRNVGRALVNIASVVTTELPIPKTADVTTFVDTVGGTLNACTPNPCLNGGTCTQTFDSFTCSCTQFFFGSTCFFPVEVTLVAPNTPLVYENDINVALDDNISVTSFIGGYNDLPATGPSDMTLTFIITGGTLTLGTTGVVFGGDGNGSSSFTATGQAEFVTYSGATIVEPLVDGALNIALDEATFTPTPNLFGENAGNITFTAVYGPLSSKSPASVTFDILGTPTLTIEKTLTNAEDSEVDTDGETIEYTITIANTGNVDLTGVVVGDAFAGGATLTSGDDGDNILETNETWTYTADYLVTQADLNAGTALKNTASVVTTELPIPKTDDVTTTITKNPSLTIEKTADKATVSVAGEEISYTITVENNGNVDLTNVVMTDVFAGGTTYSSGDDGDNILETTETWTYTADYVVTQADLNAGTPLKNTATVDTDKTDEQQDDVSSTISQSPTLTIEKTLTNAEDAIVDSEETIEYTITIDNTGNVDLTGVVVGDEFAGGATLTSGDDGDNILETTETWTYTADYLVTQADLNAGTALKNTATVDTDQTDEQQNDVTSTISQSPCDIFFTADAGADTAVFFGPYAPVSCATITGSASGGIPFPGDLYRFQWDNGPVEEGNSASLSVEVCPVVDTQYTLTVTDASGCITTDQVMVYAVNIGCTGPGNNNKVQICINGNSACVAVMAVEAVLAGNPNATLGPCVTTLPGITIYPNPNNGQFIMLSIDEIPKGIDQVAIELFDRTGRRILAQLHPLGGPSTLLVIHPETYLGSGVYVVHVTLGDQRHTQHLMVQQ
jgi:uncharacterized repeat protein (TIGR01451 family)